MKYLSNIFLKLKKLQIGGKTSQFLNLLNVGHMGGLNEKKLISLCMF